ncbi:MAG: hypothetical protein ACO1Q7_00790 [Gemmatimonas sp.]
MAHPHAAGAAQQLDAKVSRLRASGLLVSRHLAGTPPSVKLFDRPQKIPNLAGRRRRHRIVGGILGLHPYEQRVGANGGPSVLTGFLYRGPNDAL